MANGGIFWPVTPVRSFSLIVIFEIITNFVGNVEMFSQHDFHFGILVVSDVGR